MKYKLKGTFPTDGIPPGEYLIELEAIEEEELTFRLIGSEERKTLDAAVSWHRAVPVIRDIAEAMDALLESEEDPNAGTATVVEYRYLEELMGRIQEWRNKLVEVCP